MGRNGVAGAGRFGFSGPQLGIWFDTGGGADDSLYRLSTRIRLDKPLGLEELTAAVRVLGRRHPMLGARLTVDSGSPEWLIDGSDLPAPRLIFDSLQDSTAREESIARFVEEPFDRAGPFIRIGVFRGAEGSEELIFVWNHLIADGWSAGIVLSELKKLYESGDPESFELPAPSAAYEDFGDWSTRYPNTDRGREDLAFWKAELEGADPFWCLPLRSPASFHIGSAPLEAEVAVELPGGLHGGATLFEHCLAAYFTLLAAYGKRANVAVSIPTLGRPSRSYAATVGHFVNPLVLGLSVEPHSRFSGVLGGIRQKLRTFRNHELYPFVALARELGLEASPGHRVLTDAYCGMVKIPGSGNAGFRFGEFRQSGSPWNLGFEIYSGDDRRWGLLRAPGWAWSRPELELAAGRLSELIARASGDPELRVGEAVRLSSEEEREFQSRRDARKREVADFRAAAPLPDTAGAGSIPAPGTETSAAVRAVWEEVLGRRDFGLDDDFFSLGGHSLAAARVSSRIRSGLGREIPMSALFIHRTIDALARYVDDLGADSGPVHPGFEASPALLIPEGDQVLPLSFSQARMWFLNQLDPEDTAYNMHAALRVRGPLDLEALAEAFEDLQERHDVLRCVFALKDGEPVQVVRPKAYAEMEEIDLRGSSAAEEEADRHVRESAARPYDLRNGETVRLLAITLADGEHIISMGMHHIVSDQWTWGVVSRDITEFYAARKERRPPVLPALELRYGDYALRDRRMADSPRMLRSGEFWKERLAGIVPLELPADRSRNLGRTRKGGAYRRKFSQALLASVFAMAADSVRTPFMIFLSAFAATLYRYSGQSDFAVGVPFASRDDPRLEDLAGTFVNTLALRITLRPDDTFRTLLSRVNDTFMDAYEHREYPFERLVGDLRPNRSTGAAPLVQVLFNVANAPGRLPFERDLTVEPYFVDPAGSQFELSLGIDDSITRQADFSFDRGVFNAESVKRMADAWFGILERGLAAPDIPLSELVLADEAERDLVVDAWNRTGSVYSAPGGVAALLWDRSGTKPDATALVFDGREFSYRELYGRASALASALGAHGVQSGDIVALHLERGPALVISMLAVLARGAAYLPLDPVYPEVRKRYMLTHSGAKAVIEEPGAHAFPHEALAEGAVRRIALDSLPEPIAPVRPVPVDPESPAYILYTSGSTGTPKGVVIPHRALANFLVSMIAEPGISADDRLLAVTSPSFDISGLEIYLPLLAGATLVLASRPQITDPFALRSLMRERGITFMQATPATWRMLLDADWTESLKTALCGGEAFPPDLIAPMRERCGAVWNMYGPTETTIWSTLHRVSGEETSVPVGRPIANTQAYVLDGDRCPVPPLVVGDLYIAGDGLSLGYHRSPDLTDAAFVPIPWNPARKMYRTGDRARFLANGELEFFGRADAQVKLNGHRIELEEIEAVIASFPGIRRAVCALKEPVAGEKRLQAFLVLDDPEARPSDEALDRHVLSKLPQYMLPSAYGIIDAVPLGPSGKVDRKALPVLAGRAASAATPPADPEEEAILFAWREVLGRNDFGVEDDFFALGGHSLLAVRLVAAMKKVTGKELPLRLFFGEPTVRGCARRLSDGERPVPAVKPPVQETDVLYPINVDGSRKPIFLVTGVHVDENGTYRYLSSLVRHMGREQPIYLLRPRGLRSPAPLYASAREIAADYVRAIKAVAPEGPYRLVGECVGGIHAYETARQLRAAGDEMQALVLLDTDYPRSLSARALAPLRLFCFRLFKKARGGLRLLHPYRGSFRRIASAGLAFLNRRRAAVLPRTPEELKARQYFMTEARYARLARAYPMPEYPGRVDLLVNSEAYSICPGYGWRTRSGAPKRGPRHLRIASVPGDHVTRLTDHGEETCRTILRVVDGEAQ